MQSEQATPAWSEENSASFIAYGRFFNPERERQFEVIGDRVAAAVEGETAPLFVELCCGAGDLAAFLLGRFPAARYLALDGSPAMLAEAAKQCATFRERLTTPVRSRQRPLAADAGAAADRRQLLGSASPRRRRQAQAVRRSPRLAGAGRRFRPGGHHAA